MRIAYPALFIKFFREITSAISFCETVCHFFFDTTGAKKKFTKRNADTWGLRPTPRELLKKLDQNFKAGYA